MTNVQTSLPTLTTDKYGCITFTFSREGKEVNVVETSDFNVSVNRTNEQKYIKKFNLLGNPEDDGFYYFLLFSPLALGPQKYAFQLNADEANFIKSHLDARLLEE